MNFLAPAALALGALAIPILILYMLKLRRREVVVSSTLLWQMLLRDRQANAPWQRLKRNLLLFLQLLILAALVLALARPAIAVPAVASGNVIVLLDASASMNATDVEPTRFEAARAAARSLVEASAGEAGITLIEAGNSPRVLASGESDLDTLRRALDDARTTNGGVNWEAAFALAAGASGAQPDQTTIVIISDGGLPTEGLPPLPGEVRYVPIGQSGDNLAIAALALRPAATGAELFARVTNDGDADRAAILSLYAGGRLLSSQQIDVPAGGSRSIVLTNLPTQSTIYQARLSRVDRAEQPLDALPLDDNAFAIYRPPGARRVLLVSTGNLFLEQLLASLPDLTPYRIAPAEGGSLQLPADPFDLYIFDRIIPGDLPQANALLIDPPSNSLFTVGEVFTATTPARVIDHPLTRFVEWSDVSVRRAHRIDPPAWAKTLVETDAGPLVFAGETGGRRVAALTFDLHDSDLPLRIAYPILFANLIDYLAPARGFDAGDGLRPGDSLTIRPDLNTEQIVIASPSGRTYSPPLGENGAVFKDTGELGVYAVNYLSASSQSADFFAVNLFDPNESNIRPAAAVQIGQGQIASSTAGDIGWRELWPWLAGAAFSVLLLEWWLYHRRGRIINP